MKNTWKKIDAWFDANGATQNIAARRAPATASDLDALTDAIGRDVPRQLADSLRIHDGGADLDSYELLSCADIANRYEVMNQWRADGVAWDDTWIPFAADSGGNLLCIDPKNVVHFVEPRTVEAGMAARSYKAWLAAYLQKLEDGELAVDDEGFVSEPITPPSIEAGPALPRVPDDLSDRLVEAIEADDPDLVLSLLDQAGLGLDVTVRYDEPVLGLAASVPAARVVRALLDAGAPVDAGASVARRTALFWACWGPKADDTLVELLLSRGADPNAMTAYDGTPLHSAAMWQHTELIRALLDAGADPSATDAQGRRPSAYAKGVALELLEQ